MTIEYITEMNPLSDLKFKEDEQIYTIIGISSKDREIIYLPKGEKIDILTDGRKTFKIN